MWQKDQCVGMYIVIGNLLTAEALWAMTTRKKYCAVYILWYPDSGREDDHSTSRETIVGEMTEHKKHSQARFVLCSDCSRSLRLPFSTINDFQPSWIDSFKKTIEDHVVAEPRDATSNQHDSN